MLRMRTPKQSPASWTDAASPQYIRLPSSLPRELADERYPGDNYKKARNRRSFGRAITRWRSAIACVTLCCLSMLLWLLAVDIRGLFIHATKAYNYAEGPGKQSPVSDATTASGRMPVVDHSAINQITHAPSINVDFDIEDIQQTSLHDVPHFPPIVTALPESRPSTLSGSKHALTGSASTDELDARFCWSSPCRLLLPLAITEREPKAQTQLWQLHTLTNALNRTLVLPNAGHDRLGTCLRWEYSVYFDIASTAHAGGTRVMMMDDFRTWVDMRPRAPVGLIVSVDEQKTEAQTGDSPADHVRVQVEASPGLQLRSARCLGTRFRRLDANLSSSLSAHLDIPLDSASVSTDADLGAILATTLLEESTVITDDRSELEDDGDQAQKQKQIPTYSTRDAEVLLVHWDVHRQLYLPSDSALIEYSSKLWALAEKLTASLGPYLAVHWRPEKLPPALVSACSDALVDALDMLLHDETSAYGIKSILLVTDRPPSGSDLNATANNKEAEMAQKHMEASKVLKTAFAPGGELEKWSLTNLADELARINASLHHGGSLNITSDGDETAILGDPGVVGILRKMVATTSDLFVSSRGRCGVTSASARHIADLRERRKNNERHIPRNIVNFFD